MKLDRLNDGVIAASGAGGDAIDPGSEHSGGLARANGVSGVAAGLYPPPPSGEQYIPSSGEEYIPSSGEEYIYIPPLLVVQEGNTMALTPPVGQAGVPSTPLPSGQVDSLGSTASEALPSDNIPPPIFLIGGGEYDGFGATG